MQELIGQTLGKYQIKEKIGQGGMAHVFKAYQPGLNRYVAVKVLAPGLASDADFTERFQREARSVAQLNHPNILQVYDYGTEGQYTYIVMRYVENSKTLATLIRDKAPLKDMINYITQVADALNYAHEQGIVHRDVKPANILIDGKWALLSDFGLVKMGDSGSGEEGHGLTRTGLSMGTPAYMSPEQASGKEVDHRTDIYALGIILHRILTGTVPHDAKTPLAIAVRRTTEPVPSLRAIKPDVPESIEQVVLRSLAINPNLRYNSAGEFADALKQAEINPGYREPSITIPTSPVPPTDSADGATVTYVSEKTETVEPPKPPKREEIAPPPQKQSHTGLIAGGVAVILALALLAFFVMPRGGGSNETPTPASPGSGVAGAGDPSPTPTPEVTTAPTPIPKMITTPVLPGVAVLTAKTQVEVLSGPGEMYDLLGRLPQNARAEIIGQDEAMAWWQIKTTLSSSGAGWVEADPAKVEAFDTASVPIALAPSTPTATPPPDTPTPTSPPATETPTPTNTFTPGPTVIRPTNTPTPSPTPALPAGQFVLLKPASLDEDVSFGMTTFEWQWTSPLEKNQGFEVRAWRGNNPPMGVHSATEDNINGKVKSLGNNTYRLETNISGTDPMQGSGEYSWAVYLIQLDPYQELGPRSAPGVLRFEAGGSRGSNGDDNDDINN